MPAKVAPIVAGAVLLLCASAEGQPRRQLTEGAVERLRLVHSVEPARGFIDDPLAFDGAGGRLLYFASDAGSLVELHVLDAWQSFAKLVTIDLSTRVSVPEAAHFVLDGEHVLVIFREGAAPDAPKRAVLVDRRGKVKRSFGPATDIGYAMYDGAEAVSLYERKRRRDRDGKVSITHTVEVRRLGSGRRLGKKTTLVADESGRVASSGFRIEHWQDGYATAVGIKDGTWDRKEDQRSPDVLACYDLPHRVFSKTAAIGDPRRHAKLALALAEHDNEASFLRVTEDLSGLQWFRNGAPAAVRLAEPFEHYDPKSLRYQGSPDGGAYFSLTIDPVNPDAVARKKADPKWLDLYRLERRSVCGPSENAEMQAGQVGTHDRGATQACAPGCAIAPRSHDGGKLIGALEPGTATAKRLGRLLVGKRPVAWIASGEHWVVLDKHIGFSRGGKSLRVYAIGGTPAAEQKK